MKPSGNLTRRVPLARGAALQRRTPLEPGKGLKRSPFLRQPTIPEQPTRKPRKQPGEKAARELVYARSDGWCEIGIPELCTQLATEWHHRKLKGQGGRWCAGNGLHGCSRCHLAVTNTNGHRPEYVHAGWLVPAWVKRPAAVKVNRWDHATQSRTWVLLVTAGGCRPTGEVAG